jgi:hypothetical protein
MIKSKAVIKKISNKHGESAIKTLNELKKFIHAPNITSAVK